MRLCIFLHGAEVPPSPGLHILEARSLFTSHALYKGHQTFVFVMLGPHGINTFFLRVSLTIAAQKRCVLSLD
uniref:Uncharacterized protein n=1 Tax=Anguilla anguilla TaxID=7936 RepID=A0A0E9T2H5_ANGAN